ncbi:MAG: RAMP superfamily CRISPR-associated protein [Acidobacteriota bacterium]
MRLNFTLKLQSDYHVGAGYGRGSRLDSVLLRDGDGVPVLRGSTLEGLLRDGLQRLLGLPALQILIDHRRCEASGLSRSAGVPAYCRTDLCPVCTVLGTPALPKPWSFSSARPAGLEKPLNDFGRRRSRAGGQPVARVRVSPRTRRAENHKLFQQEEGGAHLEFQFNVENPIETADTCRQAALLVAAARMTRRLGSARRRGRGECRLTLTSIEGWPDETPKSQWQNHLLDHFEKAWLEGKPVEITEQSGTEWTSSPPESTDSKRFRVVLRLDEPVVVSRRAQAGMLYDSLSTIGGTTLLGALATAMATRCRFSQAKEQLAESPVYQDFLKLFRDGAVRFGPLYRASLDREEAFLAPAVPAPFDRLVCKVKDHHVSAHSYAQGQELPACPICASPLVSPHGFFPVQRHKDASARAVPDRCEELHPRIDPKTQRVEKGALYGYVAFAVGQYFMGELWCRDGGTWQDLCRATGLAEKEAASLRIGKANRRGYGLVTAWIESVDQPIWSGQPIDQRVDGDEQPITMTLLSDVILQDRWGRFLQTLDVATLQEIIGPEVDNVIQIFCKSGIVDGFYSHLGLPRWRDVALKAGSAVGFKVKAGGGLRALCDKLERVERDGIGLRRNEGFGLVVFNHPVYSGCEKVGDTQFRLPPQLRLSDPKKDSAADQLQTAVHRLKDTQRTYQSKSEEFDKRFKIKEWRAVAGWLHSRAGDPIDDLKSGLNKFDFPTVITNHERDKKGRLAEANGAMTYLKDRLDELGRSDNPVFQRLGVELLAGRIASSAKKEARRGQAATNAEPRE